jgi:hypothetical protein
MRQCQLRTILIANGTQVSAKEQSAGELVPVTILITATSIIYKDTRSRMTSRPPSSSSSGTGPSKAHPTPHNTASRSHNTATSTRVPPNAPKPSRRPTASSAPSNQTNPVFSLAPPSLVPHASCGKPDDILAPPDAQSCPFAKAGTKLVGMGPGPYGELEGRLDWPAELYTDERTFCHTMVLTVGKQAQVQKEIKGIYSQDDRLLSKGAHYAFGFC